MPQSNSPIINVPAGPEALSALIDAVDLAKAEDRFARVVVIADHHDAARSVRHHLGNQGMINVTVQTGRRLASEMAKPVRKPLPRLLELQAVRQTAEGKAQELGLDPTGQRRFYRSLITTFREMQERHETPSDADAGPNEMNHLAESLHNEFLEQVRERGYYTVAELPQMAADALSALPKERVPAIIYYLPRRLSDGDLRLGKALLDHGKCQVVVGLTGDDSADHPVHELLGRLGYQWAGGQVASGDGGPLRQRTVNDALSIVVAPDPGEEVRSVIRRIAAGKTPFHRVAVVYRQDNPYASLLRQELDFARIPFSGVDYRRLADTPTGLLLTGLMDLAVAVNADSGDEIDRERLIEWLTTTPVRLVGAGDNDNGRMTAPAAAWAKLAREASANGGIQNWDRRLRAYLEQVRRREVDRGGGDDDDNEFLLGLRQRVDELRAFLDALVGFLRYFGDLEEPRWESAAKHLKDTMGTYRWVMAEEAEEDRRRIEELVDSLAGLEHWEVEYSPEVLQETIGEALQTPVSERGRPVGSGVYIGPPSGAAGADYDTVYAVGMVERQFPPRPRANPWLTQNSAEMQRAAELERYDFLCAIASAQSAVLSWPAATADRSVAYPSRWLIEAANHLHDRNGGRGRLTHENLTADASSKSWLTVIPSREAGLRNLARNRDQTADELDYNLMHLVSAPRETLPQHLAIGSDPRMIAFLEARRARNGDKFSAWDGYVGADATRVSSTGSREWPIAPTALETWATCPYRYFLRHILGLSASTVEEDAEISALERGSLVHLILERFANDENDGNESALLALAEEEFGNAEARGVTGHHLLWEVAKDNIRHGLQTFLRAERNWLNTGHELATGNLARAEVDFGPPSRRTDRPTQLGEVSVAVEGLDEPVWLRGKIDRIDDLGNRAVVRDFKTGRPRSYTSGAGAQDAYTVSNGRALQLPVYVAAAEGMPSAANFEAAYCFPLEDPPVFDGRPYRVEADQEEFHTTLRKIVGGARAGVFPATPDGDSQHGNCRYCDFKRLCPIRRRQIWVRKAKGDAVTVEPFNALGGRAKVVSDDNNS